MKRKSILTIAVFLLSTNSLYAVITNGLVAYYPFNGNAKDASGNGNDGTVHGATLTSDRFGNPNSAYFFDGIDDYISINYHSDFQLPTYTISAWIKPAFNETTLTSGVVFISRGEDFSSDNAALCFGIHELSFPDNGIFLSYEDSSDGDYGYGTGDFPEIDKWSHLAATRSSDGTLSIYLNGGLLNSWDLTPIPTSQCFQDITIGAYWYSPTTSGQYLTNFFNGSIDDIMIYDKALTVEQINQLSAIPAPSAILLVGLGTGFVGWLRRRKTI